MVAKRPKMIEGIVLFANGKWAPTKVQEQNRRLPTSFTFRQPDGSEETADYLCKFSLSNMAHPIAFYLHDKIPVDTLWDEPESEEPRIWTPPKGG